MTRLQSRALSRIVLTQFLSSLADSALLIVAMALLAERHAAPWTIPALRIFFYGASLVLAPIAGRFADAYPKGRILFVTSLAKFAGCALLIMQVDPLLAYALVGISSAAYVPAKYGILPEILSPKDLVRGNAWVEISTVISILLGVGLGSVLLSDDLLSIVNSTCSVAICAAEFLLILYGFAALTALAIPITNNVSACKLDRVRGNLRRFYHDQQRLWRDHQAGVAISVTCLFWAIAAALQFLVLQWGQEVAHLSLPQSSLLQLPVAVGLVAGAIAAARWIQLSVVVKLLPLGIAIGASLIWIAYENNVHHVILLLTGVGVLSGLLLVPMNALLQHRGALLMPTGQSIAVQGFSENLASVILLSAYGSLVTLNIPITRITTGFGLLIVFAIIAMMRRLRPVVLS